MKFDQTPALAPEIRTDKEIITLQSINPFNRTTIQNTLKGRLSIGSRERKERFWHEDIKAVRLEKCTEIPPERWERWLSSHRKHLDAAKCSPISIKWISRCLILLCHSTLLNVTLFMDCNVIVSFSRVNFWSWNHFHKNARHVSARCYKLQHVKNEVSLFNLRTQ